MLYDEFRNRWNKHFNCFHQSRKLVWTDRGTYGDPLSGTHLREQCQDCGIILGQDVSRSRSDRSTPKVNIMLLEKYLDEDEFLARHPLAVEVRLGDRRQKQEIKAEEEFGLSYEEYLQTDEWWKRREKVMARSRGVCEGCQINMATQVHHLTYRHIGEEFLWELVAICDECHRRCHKDKA